MITILLKICLAVAIPFSAILFAVKIAVWAGYLYVYFGVPIVVSSIALSIMVIMTGVGLFLLKSNAFIVATGGKINEHRNKNS